MKFVRLCSVASLAACTLAAGAACSGSDAPPADSAVVPAGGAASPGAPATGQPVGAQRGGTAEAERVNYRLTMPAVDRYYAAMRGIYQAVGRNTELAQELEVKTGVTVDDFEAQYDGVPEFRQAIEAAGLDAREFSLLLITLSSARNAHSAGFTDATKAAVAGRFHVAPENLDFYRQNREVIEQKERDLARMAEG